MQKVRDRSMFDGSFGLESWAGTAIAADPKFYFCGRSMFDGLTVLVVLVCHQLRGLGLPTFK